VNAHAPAAGRFLQLAGAALLAFAGMVVTVAGTPGAALATVGPIAAVAPTTGLADGQTVTVSASGLPANHAIQVEECAGTVDNPPPDNSACDGVTLDSSTDSDGQGGYANDSYTVYTRPSSLLSSPATITCDAGHPCVLYVGVDQNNFSSPHAFAPLTFSDTVTTTTTASTTTSTTHPSSTSTTATSTTATTSHSSSTTTTHPKGTTTTTARSSTTTTYVCEKSRPKCASTTTTAPSIVPTAAPADGTTTTTEARSTGTTQPPTTVTTAPSLQAQGGGGSPGLGDAPPAPQPVPSLPLTGGPHGAALLAAVGVVVVLGGTELRRRTLRGAK
jgi:Neocarzinostatin family